jgi:hypothetical protein
MNKQRGFLAIMAVVMIVIIGIMSAAIVSLSIRAGIIPMFLDGKNKADFIAQSGLEQGRYNLTIDTLTDRSNCASLSNTTGVTGGSFTVVPAAGTNPRYVFSTLSGGIISSSTPTTITVTDSSVFAPYGRILIGREVFQYDRIANGTTLAGVTRAKDGTIAQAHSNGAMVSQHQCTIQSTGTATTVTPNAVRQYRQGIQQPTVFAAGESGTILRFNGANELAWDTQASGSFLFNAISVQNYHSGWAVADRQTNQIARLARFQGNLWVAFTVTFASANDAQNLHGVFTTSASEAWSVGEVKPGGGGGPPGGGGEFTILHWVRDGSNLNTNWCRVPTSGVSCNGVTVSTSGVGVNQRDLFAIKALDINGTGLADMGFAVGGEDGSTGGGANKGVIMSYNGTQWDALSLPASSIGQMYGVDIVENGTSSPSEAFFVGRSSKNSEGGKILRLRSGLWSVITPTQIMRSVSAVDTNGDGLADFIVAVGDSGLVYFLNSSFGEISTTSLGSPDLTGVVALSSTDIWVVGSGGVRWHYNGSTWVSNASGGNNLNGVSAVYPKQTPESSWYDVIN